MSSLRSLSIGLLMAALLVSACGGSPAQPTATPVANTPAAQPTQPPAETEPTAAPTEVPTVAPTATQASSSSGGSQVLDLGALFPPGPGREAVLNNCTNCHNIAPLVTLQKTAEDWQRTNREHREMRVPTVSDEENELIYEYLSEHYNENTPVPELPQILIDAWTSY